MKTRIAAVLFFLASLFTLAICAILWSFHVRTNIEEVPPSQKVTTKLFEGKPYDEWRKVFLSTDFDFFSSQGSEECDFVKKHHLGKAHIPLLIQLASEKEDLIHSRALESLVCLQAKGKPVESLYLSASIESNSSIRIAAARGMENLDPSPDITARLREMLHDESDGVRFEASVTLWNIKKANDALGCLESLIQTNSDYRGHVFNFLLKEHPNKKEVLRQIAKCIHKDEDNFMRITAIRILGEYGKSTEEVLIALQKGIKDTNIDIRINASISFWQITRNSKLSINCLKKILQASEAENRQKIEAIDGLGTMGSDQALIDFLRSFENSPELDISLSAERAIEDIRNRIRMNKKGRV